MIEKIQKIIKYIEYVPYKWNVIIRDPYNSNNILIQRRYQYLEDMQYDLQACFTYQATQLYAKEKYICLDNIIEFFQIYEKY